VTPLWWDCSPRGRAVHFAGLFDRSSSAISKTDFATALLRAANTGARAFDEHRVPPRGPGTFRGVRHERSGYGLTQRRLFVEKVSRDWPRSTDRLGLSGGAPRPWTWRHNGNETPPCAPSPKMGVGPAPCCKTASGEHCHHLTRKAGARPRVAAELRPAAATGRGLFVRRRGRATIRRVRLGQGLRVTSYGEQAGAEGRAPREGSAVARVSSRRGWERAHLRRERRTANLPVHGQERHACANSTAITPIRAVRGRGRSTTTCGFRGGRTELPEGSVAR